MQIQQYSTPTYRVTAATQNAVYDVRNVITGSIIQRF